MLAILHTYLGKESLNYRMISLPTCKVVFWNTLIVFKKILKLIFKTWRMYKGLLIYEN